MLLQSSLRQFLCAFVPVALCLSISHSAICNLNSQISTLQSKICNYPALYGTTVVSLRGNGPALWGDRAGGHQRERISILLTLRNDAINIK
jgi:hypothetical protein